MIWVHSEGFQGLLSGLKMQELFLLHLQLSHTSRLNISQKLHCSDSVTGLNLRIISEQNIGAEPVTYAFSFNLNRA